jgi:hypothetical protein
MKMVALTVPLVRMIVGFYAVPYFLIKGQWAVTVVSILVSTFVLHECFGEGTLVARLNRLRSRTGD